MPSTLPEGFSIVEEPPVLPEGFSVEEDSTPPLPEGFSIIDEPESPTTGQVATGVVTEIAAGITGQVAGTAIGTAILPGVGTAAGYVVGSLGSGVAGSIAAQKLEGKEDISWGRAIAAGLINLAPGGTGKGVKGAMTIGKVAAREATKGAAFGVTEATSRAIIDEGRLPTTGELAQWGGTGALFGGAVGTVATKIGRKFAGKSVQEIDEAVATKEIGYKDLDWVMKQGQEGAPTGTRGIIRREVAETRERVLAREAQEALASESSLKIPSVLKRVWATASPSRVVKRATQEETISFRNKIRTAEAEASRIERYINKYIDVNPQARKHVEDFLDGHDIPPSIERISPQLNRFRESMKELKIELIAQIDAGQMKSMKPEAREALRVKIQKSLEGENYVTREYEIFTNKKFVQNPKLRAEAEAELSAHYLKTATSFEAAQAKAKEHMDFLVSRSARNLADKPDGHVGASLEGILRRQKKPGPAERRFLGEITDPGARMRGTLTRTARLVARNAADANIAKELELAGIASRVQQSGMETLDLRGSDPTGMFVMPEVQIAINKLYADNFVDKSNDIIQDGAKDLIMSGIGLSKAVKVLGNLPSYAVQLWGNAANLGGMFINPFNPAQMSRGMRLALSDFGWVEDLTTNPKARKALLDEMRTMEKYGLKGGNVIESDLRSTLDQGIFSKAIGKAVDPFGKVYSSLDVMMRYVGWKGTQKTMRKLYPTLDEESVKKAAALVINDTFQNYDKLSNTVRWASRWGIMPQFASFTAEFMRNQYNQGRMIKQMLTGQFGKELGLDLAKADIGKMRAEGATRLASLLAVYGGAYGVTQAISSQNNVDDRKDLAMRETVIADWDRNKQLAMSISDDGKRASYANMSYIVPHSVGLAALKAGMDGSDVTSVAGLLVEELVGEGTFINKEAMRALDNRNERGQKISYSESDYEQFKDRLTYFIAQSFKPGTAREIDKAMKAHRGVGDYTMREIGLRQLGYRVNKLDINESAKFNITRTKDNMQMASRDYYVSRDYKNLSAKDIEGIYNRANESRRESFNQMVRHNQNLVTLGRDESERIAILKSAKLGSGEILAVLDGEYIDLPRVKRVTISDTYAALPEDNGARIARIRQIYKEDPKMGRSLLAHHKRELTAQKRGLDSRDALLRNMDTATRAEYISRKSRDNPKYLNEMRRKGLVTQEVMRQIRAR